MTQATFWNNLMKVAAVVLCTGMASGSVQGAGDPYELQSEFGDTISCDYVTEGIFVVWWDNRNDLTEEAYILLDTMQVYRDQILDSLGLQDPPNPLNGFYFNIYLHESGDVFPEGWGCGVGTDVYSYPYMTLPIPTVLYWDWITISHETFHIFQYAGDTPGFSGSSGVFWFIEATANWYAAITHPDAHDAFVEAMTLVKVPHVTMWLGYDNFPSYYPENWQRYCHQYAMALFLYYLTEVEGMPDSLVCGGFYNGVGFPQNLNPQEYLLANCEGDLRDHFMNWAARMTNGYDFVTPEQLDTAEDHWNTYADPEDDNQFTGIFLGSGSGGWYSPPDSLVTTSWSFNTYKLLNMNGSAYTFSLLGDKCGSMGDSALFRGKVVVLSSAMETRFYDLEMQNEVYGTLTVNALNADTAMYLIVGSLPEVFSGTEQTFPHAISIEPILSSGEPQAGKPCALALGSCYPNPFSSQTIMTLQIPVNGTVSLQIFDIAGRVVSIPVDQELTCGTHQISWDGRDRSGSILPGGLYVARLQHLGNSVTQLITILR